MHRCKYCGDKVPDTARCCFKCGNLNPYNETNIEEGIDKLHDVEELDITDESKRKTPKFSTRFKLSFILDILSTLFASLFVFLLSDLELYIEALLVTAIWAFYRLVVLKFLLFKSGMAWWGVYVPFYGLWLYFELGIISPTYTLTSIMVIIFSAYWIMIGLKALPIFGLIIFIILVIYLLIMHIKVCDGYCFRFKKDKRFKILLAVFWLVLMPYLAFNKDSGRINKEEDSSTKV